jgi:hypothetical protein
MEASSCCFLITYSECLGWLCTLTYILPRIRSFAFLGAVVSTFSLVIGPSFQQSLVFYSDSVVNMSAVSYSSGFRNSNGIVVDWISSLPGKLGFHANCIIQSC